MAVPVPSPAPAVVTLGECMAVLYPPRPVPLEETDQLLLDVAGTEANTAIGLARLGVSVRLISRVGDDPFGRRVRATLVSEGVDTTHLETDPAAPTGVFFREPRADGSRIVYYYRAGSAASRMTAEQLHLDAFAGSQLVQLSGITPALSPGAAADVRRAIDLAYEAKALVSFDPNYRPQLWHRESAAVTLRELIHRVHILLMSEDDAQLLFGGADEAALERASALGPAIVVLKRAERGALALAEGQVHRAPAQEVKRVVDTVGAGDGFNAGFLAGTLRGLAIPDALKLGAQVGAKAVAQLGDYSGYPRKRGRGKRETGRG